MATAAATTTAIVPVAAAAATAAVGAAVEGMAAATLRTPAVPEGTGSLQS